MTEEEPMKFNPRKRTTIFIVFAVVIWIISFLVWYGLFYAVEIMTGYTGPAHAFIVNFSILLATLVCIESWLLGAFELVEKWVMKRNLERHLRELDS